MVGLAAPPHMVQDFTSKAMNELGAELITQLIAQKPGENINFSPWSITNALTLTSSGAQGETQDELYRLLRLNHLRGYENYHDRALKALNDHLLQAAQLQDPQNPDAPTSILNFATGLWSNADLGIEPQAEFQALAQEYYAALLESARFGSDPQSVRTRINAWIEANTNGNLQNVISEDMVRAETAALLVNAIAFKAAWEDEFNEGATQPGAFTTASGQRVETPKMHATLDHVNTVRTDDFIAIDLPYQGRNYTMTLVLPNEGKHEQTQAHLVQGEGFAKLGELMSGGEAVRTELYLPKVKFQSNADIKRALQAMGVETPFASDADYSGLFGQRGITISEIVHQATIDIHEKGTDASAVTVVSFMLTSMPFRPEPVLLDVNRPFFYVIRDTTYSTPLFMGVVNDPTR